MSDLISRSKLTEAIKRQYCTYCNNYKGLRCRACHADDMLSLVDDAADAGPGWISVDDEQKPMHGHDYLCVCTLPNDPEHKFDWISVRWWNSTTGNGYVDRPHFSDEGVKGVTVTHWMPLPPMPKEG